MSTCRLNGGVVRNRRNPAAHFHFAPVGSADYWIPLQRLEPAATSAAAATTSTVWPGSPTGCQSRQLRPTSSSIAKALEQQYPDSNRDQGATVVDLTEVVVGSVRPILWLLLGGAALLMVIASLNVAGLLVVRSESRRRELAVRSALGASSGRVVAQFVMESVVLVGLALAIGIGAVVLGRRLVDPV